MARQARVSITADVSGLERGVARGEKALDRLRGSATRLDNSLSPKKLLGFAAGLGGIAGAGAALKDAVKTTEDLAKGTAGLQRITGLDTKTASAWVETMKLRGVESTKLNMAFKTLAVAQGRAKDGSERQTKAFQALGVSLAELEKLNTQELLGEMAEGFDKMADGPKKAEVASILFGRGYATLLPLLNSGKVSMQEALEVAEKYGATLDKAGVKKALEAVKAQREYKTAMDGLKISIATGLMPTITKVTGTVATFIGQMRTGKGAGGEFARTIKSIVTFLKEHETTAKRVAIGVGGILLAYKTLKTAVTVISTVKTAMSGIVTAAGAVKTGLIRVLGGAGTTAGATAANNAAASVASTMPTAVNSKRGRLVGTFRGLGRAMGLAMGAALLIAFKDDLDKLSSEIEQRKNEPGARGKVWRILFGPIGLGDQPTSKPRASQQGVEVGAKALGGWIPGPSWTDATPILASGDEFITTGPGQQQAVASGLAHPLLWDWLARNQHPHFASGGRVSGKLGQQGYTVRGPVSWFSGQGTAYGFQASSTAGIALNPLGGADWNSKATRSLEKKLFLVTVQGHSAQLPVIDVGPHARATRGPMAGQWRAIDITAPGVRKMGLDPDNFPTDSIGTAVLAGAGATTAGRPGSTVTTRTPITTKPRMVDLLSATVPDAFSQGFQFASSEAFARGWAKSPFFDYRGRDTDLTTQIMGDYARAYNVTTTQVPGDAGGAIDGAGNFGGADNLRVQQALKAGFDIARASGVRRAAASVFAATNVRFGGGLGISPQGGRASRNNRSFHPSGQATDIINRATGSLLGQQNRTVGQWVQGNFSPSERGTGEQVFFIDRHAFRPGDHDDHVHVSAAGDKILPKVYAITRQSLARRSRSLRRGGLIPRFQSGTQTGPGVVPGLGYRPWADPRRTIAPGATMPAGVLSGGGNVVAQLMQAVAYLFAAPITTPKADIDQRLRDMQTIAWGIVSDPSVTLAQIQGVERNVQTRLRGLGPEIVGPEQVQAHRMKDVLSVLEPVIAGKLAAPVGQYEAATADISRGQTRLGYEMTIAGISPTSPEGVARQRQFAEAAIGQLQQRREAIQQRLAEAQAIGQPQAVEALTNALNSVDDTILQLQAGVVELGEGVDENTAAQEAQRQAALELKEQIKDLEEQQLRVQKQIKKIQKTELGVIKRAIADVVNGEIGGRLGLGFQTPSYAGGVSRT